MERQILVPLDGSLVAESALAPALALARITQHHLHLLQVIPRTPGIHAGDWRFQQAHAYLQSAAWRLRQRCPAISIQRTVLDGQAAPGIAAFALEHTPVREIVMATHGWGGGGTNPLGSVAEQVVQETPVPIMLTRSGQTPPLIPREMLLDSIVVALDGSPLAEGALDVVVNLVRHSQAKITLLTVVGFMHDISEAGLLPLWALSGVPAVRDQAQDYLESTAAILRHDGLHVQTRVVEGSAADSILATSASVGADMIVMTTQGWSGLRQQWMGATVSRVVRTSRIPVLLIRPSASMESSQRILGEQAHVTRGW